MGILAAGGNAVDAAIAATVAQGVVAPETCGVGGDLFALVHRPGWAEPRALNASGRAGSGADPASLRTAGMESIPTDHPAAVTVPGCVDGLLELATLGRRPLGTCLAPAIELARDGFPASREQALAFDRNAHRYSRHPAVSEFYPEGTPVEEGETVRRPNLADTLEAVATGGREAFYRGRPGEDIVEELGGLITPDDLAQTQADWVEPISTEVAGLDAWTIPPNSQGYLGPGALAVFEMLGPPDDPDHPDWWHLLIESYRCLAWERDDLVADPAHAPLPSPLLLDRERLTRAAETVQRHRAGNWPVRPGPTSGTAYLCVVDDEGTAVSLIQSNYRGTGSSFGARRSGFLLQDRGSGFTLTPGHPNELAPGKRPLHTLSPTLWTGDGVTRWLLGTRGGGVQPQIVAQMGARTILAGQDTSVAQSAPRWTVGEFGPFSGSSLSVEPGVEAGLTEELRRRGHDVTELDVPQRGWGPVSIIGIDGEVADTARDPRVETTEAALD